MQLQYLDHVNVRTKNLKVLTDWYEEVLGLTNGWRPDFSHGGSWLYLGERPIVHLVEVSEVATQGDLQLEHFAFRATGLSELIARLKARDIKYSIDPVPELPLVQVNLADPDGNHIHVDFDAKEAAMLV